MAENHIERKRKALVERLALLEKQWQAANDQLNFTTNSADREPLKQQIKILDRDFEEVEAELKQLDLQSSDSIIRNSTFDAQIPEIDFGEVHAILNEFVNRAKADCAASLFLIQESQALGGRWCLDIIRQKIGKTYHEPIGFSFYERKDESAILQKLADRLGIQPSVDDLASEVILKLCKRIGIGTSTLIEISNWEYFCENEKALNWFVSDFWPRLVKAFHDCKRLNARLVTVLVADTPIAETLLASHACAPLEFKPEKLRPLPLRNWTQEEIEQWLVSGSLNWGEEVTEKMISAAARLIYQASRRGEPDRVYEQLRKRFACAPSRSGI